MGIKTVYVCDQCQLSSENPKDWFFGSSSAYNIKIQKFDTGYKLIDSFTFLCGENCVHKFISQELHCGLICEYENSGERSAAYSQTELSKEQLERVERIKEFLPAYSDSEGDRP